MLAANYANGSHFAYLALSRAIRSDTDGNLTDFTYNGKEEVTKIACVGDSITEGTKNGGYGWYRAIEDLSENVSQCAKGGGTTKTILPKVASDSDFYVVALGTKIKKSARCPQTST